MCLNKLRNECLLNKMYNIQEIILLYRLYRLYRLYTYKLELHQFYQSLINPMILKTSKLLYPLFKRFQEINKYYIQCILSNLGLQS